MSAGAARRRGLGLGVPEMIGATLLWGATFVVIRDTVARADPVGLVFARFAIAAPVLLLVATVARSRFTREAWIGGTLAGACAALAFTLQAAGLRHSSAGTSAFITALGSLFSGLLAWPILKQRPDASLRFGIALAVVGTALLTGTRRLWLGPGEALTLAGALCFALQVLALARFAPRADPLALAAAQATALALVVAPFGATRLDPVLISAALLPRLAYLVVAGSIVAPLLQVMAQRTLSAGRTGLLLGLEPVFAAGFAVTLGAERPPLAWWAGAALILTAVWLVERRSASASSPSPRPATG